MRITEPLSPDLEIPAAMRLAARNRGPALLFEEVRGYPGWRIAGNIFATLDRIRLALGVEKLESIGERLVEFVWRAPPRGFREKLRGAQKLLEFSGYAPKYTRSAAFRDNVVEKPRDLRSILPGLRQYRCERSPYLTYPLIVIKHPDTGVTTMSVYRVMIRGDGLVLHWQLHKRGMQAYHEWVEHGAKEIPAAIVLSADPATLLAGAFPAPYPLDKFFFTGILRGEGLELYRLENGVEVPANAEVVIEGYVTRELVEEGPFGDHWGYCDKPRRRFPLMRVTRIYYRRDPIVYATSVGKPVLEDAAIGKAVERIFLPVLRTLLPEIVDINLPEHGVFQGLAIVSIRKRYPGHAKKVMSALWGLGMMSLTKIIIVVDHDVNVHDVNEVIWAVSAHVDPQRDVVVMPGTVTDELDPAVPTPGYGSKLGIDATRKLPEENAGAEWPEELSEDEDLLRRVGEVLRRHGGLGGA